MPRVEESPGIDQRGQEQGKLKDQLPLPIRFNNRDSKLDQVDAEKKENQEKGPHLISTRTTHDDIGIKEKVIECPDPVFLLAIAGPNQCTGESEWQTSNPGNQVV